ncbi:MAG: response regulator [Deltaproteobacteria bacterium]|nr:response regulator [Deltaproteobacteria bacterium]
MAQVKKTRVMAVDDSSFMLSVITAYLKDSDFELVDTAKNGKEALEKVKICSPEVVLLDIVMPGEDGIETLEKLLSVKPDLKVIMASSLGTEEAVLECLRKGAKNFLQKPFEKDKVQEVIREVVK